MDENQQQPGNINQEEAGVLLHHQALVLAFEFLSPADLMKARVCRAWCRAVAETPIHHARVSGGDGHNAGLQLTALARAMPNMLGLSIEQNHLNYMYERIQKINRFVNLKTLDLFGSAFLYRGILGNFCRLDLHQLRSLYLSCVKGDELLDASLPNLRSLSVFHADMSSENLIAAINNFPRLEYLALPDAGVSSTATTLRGLKLPCLERLYTGHSKELVWNLSDLCDSSRLPSLKEIDCWGNENLNGDLASLKAMIQLVKVSLACCSHVTGNLLDLAHLPNLEELGVYETKVSGDIRDIRPHHFCRLGNKGLSLSKYVFGQADLESVSQAPIVMKARYDLLKQRDIDVDCESSSSVELSSRSSDWYGGVSNDSFAAPPLVACSVNFGDGLRRGWRWTNPYGIQKCEINWFDPEPKPEDCFDNDPRYTRYLKDMKHEQENYQKTEYGGYFDPPTHQQYLAIWQSKTSDEISWLERMKYLI